MATNLVIDDTSAHLCAETPSAHNAGGHSREIRADAGRRRGRSPIPDHSSMEGRSPLPEIAPSPTRKRLTAVRNACNIWLISGVLLKVA